MRLTPNAQKILQTEVEQLAQSPHLDVQRDIVTKRLHKLSQEPGNPLAKAELEQVVTDLFPQFNPKVIDRAAQANKNNKFKLGLKITAALGIGALGLSGLVWLVNLPYPMIRRPVARVAPLLLLPSYITMDRNYREAIAHVEQADQLVNNATSAADINFGAEKVKLAQYNLDQLPVWFLGYEPVKICTFMGCSWNFTFDEFSRARTQIGRMDARIFQETNALGQLQAAETTIQTAKTSYSSALNPQAQRTAIADWQSGLNLFNLIPAKTLAGSQSQEKYKAYAQEFQQVAGQVAGSSQTQTMIAAAQQFATLAQQEMAKPSLTVAEWQQIQTLWQESIQRLQQVKAQDGDYLAAQQFLANYTQQLGKTQTRLQQEQTAVQSLERAQEQIQALIANQSTQPSPQQRNQLISQLNGIITQLQKIQAGTTPYSNAQELLKQAQDTLSKL